eukprot:7431358-Karenia_brevis.AAC.1
MMDEHFSGIPYHDSRGLPNSVVPMYDPSWDMPHTEARHSYCNPAVGSQEHIQSLRRVTCEEHLLALAKTDRSAKIVE